MTFYSRKARPTFLASLFSAAILCVLAFFLPSGYGGYAPAQTCVQPPPGIIAWWPFDETSGTTAQDIIGGLNGVYVNGPVPTPGKVGGALRFNGSSSYVGAPDSDLWAFGTGNFTVELWANFDAPSSGDIVHPGDVFISSDDGPGTQNKWIFALGGGVLELIVVNTANLPPNFFLVRAPFSPVVGEWYHLAVTKTATLFTIYVNGVEVGSEVSTPPISNANAPLIIGQSNEPFGGFMNGLLDEVTIYNRALTQGELQAIVAAGSAGKCKALSITTKSLSAVRLGDFFSQQLETRFGQPPLTWSIVSGTLPSGVSLSQAGVLSGTPTEAGSFTFTVRVTDSNYQIAEKAFELAVLLTLPPPDIRIQLTGTTPVPGRALSYFVFLENLGSVEARDITIYALLEPWLTLNSATPSPTRTEERDDTFPSGVGGSYVALIAWGPLTLAPGEGRIVSYTAGLDPTFPIPTSVNPSTCAKPPGDSCTDACIAKNFPGFPTGIWNAVCSQILSQYCKCRCNGNPDSHCQLGTSEGLCPKFSFSPDPNISRLLSASGTDTDSLLICESRQMPATGPVDPNEKLVTASKFIRPDQLLVYPIHFENIGNIEARDVFVTDALDPNLDASTLNLLTPTGGAFDVATRTVKWDLLNTNLQPGKTGQVLLSVRPRPGLPSGTVIRNSAKIQFEVFQPIVTNEIVNIIDTTRPASVVAPLPPVTSTPDFQISWSGSDAVGEIDYYTILVSVNGGSFTPFLERTRATSAVFRGEPGKRYGFLSVATDTAGNIEVQSAVAEAITQVIATGADFAITKTVAPNPVLTGSNVTYTITVANNGPGVAADVMVTDTLPASTTFVSCSSTGGGVCGGSGNNRTVTFTSLAAAASATITLVASVNCSVADNTMISNTATVSSSTPDPVTNNNSAMVTTIASNPPPVITDASANPSLLWPPNHQMVNVTINYNVTDNCGPLTCTLSVTSNEPINGTGDGDTAPDWEIVDAHHVRLRAERAAAGTERVYTITITCRDTAGNSSSRSVSVHVPKSQGQN